MCYPVCGMVHNNKRTLAANQKGRKEMFYLTTHSKHLLTVICIGFMVLESYAEFHDLGSVY